MVNRKIISYLSQRYKIINETRSAKTEKHQQLDAQNSKNAKLHFLNSNDKQIYELLIR